MYARASRLLWAVNALGHPPAPAPSEANAFAPQGA